MTRYLSMTMVLGLMLVTGCAEEQGTGLFGLGPKPAPAPQTVLPLDEPEGWERAIPNYPIRLYVRENLYLYLAQKADLYNDYGFRRLAHGIYRPNLLGEPTVVVDAYIMDLPLHAYGIFSVERNRSDKMVKIGGGGHLGEKECVFWKGNHFVRVKLMADVENAEEVLKGFAVKTEKNIVGPVTIPELAFFPVEKRTPAGDSYHVDDLMGYDFLGRGFTVEYDLEGTKATMFLAILPPDVVGKQPEGGPPVPGITTTAYIKLRRALLGAGETPQVLPGPWQHAYRASEPKLGTGLVARKGRCIAGIFGCPDEKLALQMTSELAQKLP
ncbi:MAG: hypothetical protein AMK75_06710 [Planctomycetes bacterium SM23_65]|nr:MAG: hypothetical protein AMK75_06710 [Planctomycetes bacterium SM23_65]